MSHITKEQRYEIKAYLKCNKSKEFIAKALTQLENRTEFHQQHQYVTHL
jgi:hypothetical protein